MFKWLSVAIVALALIVLNVLGDSATSSNSSPHLGPNDVVGFIHGWPTEFLVRAFSEYDPRPLDWRSQTSRWPIGGVTPVRYFGVFKLAVNMAVAMVILGCAFAVAERYQERRSGPFQFGIRWILAGTLTVAGFLCLIRFEIAHWEHLVWLPVGAGLICVAITLSAITQPGANPNHKRKAACGAAFGVILTVSLAVIYCFSIDWSLMYNRRLIQLLAAFVGSLVVLTIAGGVAGSVVAYRRRPANNG